MRKDLKRFLLAPALMMMAGAAMAVPAKQGLVTVTQPDGTEVTISRHGDEWGHYVLTADSHLLVADTDGRYCYAMAGADGQPVSSGIMATQIEARTPQAKALLSSVDDQSLIAQAAAGVSSQIQAKRAQVAALQQARAQRTQARATQNPQRIPETMLFTNFPCKGQQKALVVLVQYQDVKFEHPEAPDYDAAQYFNAMLNEPGFSQYSGTGCVHDYFMECSDGQFDPQFDCFGPITLAHDRKYYGANGGGRASDVRPWEMAIEACQQLDATVDFSEYDRDGDGFIDNVFVFYAGQGEATYGPAESVWPHSFNIYGAGKTYKFDGKILDRYACANEWEISNPDGVGTFIHEFSHVMGLPDLYCTTYNAACYTPNRWSVLDQGPYNNNGRTPPLYGIFDRMSVGWVTPRKIDRAMNISLLPISSNVAYYMETSRPNEFYLYENRQKTSWDKYLPGHGMLVWHIDYNNGQWMTNSVNNNPSHQYVDLIEAGGVKLSGGVNVAAPSDPFPGTKKIREFTDTTDPAMVSWSGQGLGLPITDIQEASSMVTFKVLGGVDPIAATTATDATEVGGTNFVANWQPSPDAVSYLLLVTQKDMTYPVVNHKDVGNVTSYRVTGLQPNTPYKYKVIVIGEGADSQYSNEVIVNTGDLGLGDVAMTATEATDVEDKAFTANWEADSRADQYWVNVQMTIPATLFELNAGFDGSALPEGWTTSATVFDSTEKYCGESAPALQFDADQQWLQTCDYAEGVTGASMHIAATSGMGTFNMVEVYTCVGGEWTLKEDNKFYPTTSGKDCEITVPNGTTALRVVYNKKKNANVNIDDFKVRGGRNAYRVPVEGLEHVNAGAATSVRIDVPYAGTEYAYTVRGTKDGATSLPSNVIVVTTSGNIGISSLTGAKGVAIVAAPGQVNIVGTEAPAEVYNLMGSLIYRGTARSITLPAGFYVVRCDGKVAKVNIR